MLVAIRSDPKSLVESMFPEKLSRQVECLDWPTLPARNSRLDSKNFFGCHSIACVRFDDRKCRRYQWLKGPVLAPWRTSVDPFRQQLNLTFGKGLLGIGGWHQKLWVVASHASHQLRQPTFGLKRHLCTVFGIQSQVPAREDSSGP